MDNVNLLEGLRLELGNTQADLRTDAQMAAALNGDLTFEDLLVSFDKFFFREYSRDLFFAELKEDTARRPFLQLHLSRNGLLDQLPEGLFFEPSKASVKTAFEMAEEHRQNKKKAAAIRTFFQPFENEFFWQGVRLQGQEEDLLRGLESGVLADFFIRFWGLSPAIPKWFLTPLILLLPYAHQIAGDLLLTETCLCLLFQEKVSITRQQAAKVEAPASVLKGLGEQRLGVDTVCGSQFEEDSPLLQVSIGPLKHSTIHDYLEGGKRFALMQTFLSFFLPLGAEATVCIEVEAQKKGIKLMAGTEPVLGYSAVL